jgi:hypothetical protein
LTASFRQALLRYRDGARLHAGTPPSNKDLASLEEKVGVLCAAGFSPVDALRALACMSYYTVGFVLEEQAAQEGASDRETSWYAPPDLKRYRRLLTGFTKLRTTTPDEQFAHGLGILIAGLHEVPASSHSQPERKRRKRAARERSSIPERPTCWRQPSDDLHPRVVMQS